jgi:hypothetical protein
MLRRQFFLVLTGCSVPVLAAKTRRTAKVQGQRNRNEPKPAEPGPRFFSDDDRRVIKEYVRALPESGLPPGLAKKDKLPPGFEGHFRRKAVLPGALVKQLYPMPGDLDKRLPGLPTDYRRGLISGYVVIVDNRTQSIFDLVLAN